MRNSGNGRGRNGHAGNGGDPGVVRCAVYTRKSTDEGLDRDFNSLDAQREAAEAYIKSQAGTGWVLLPDRYDDGGFSGGNLERPALKRLLADIEAGKVDRIVVYKIDRLSRSILDFARLAEVFEQNGVGIVSVTQQFDTSTSMGRLTMNMLLSFAQFEREMVSDRTRDKLRAARRKGKFVGGGLILGYDRHPDGGKLVVNESEAERVREIFRLFLEIGTIIGVVEELKRRGWTLKRWITKTGTEYGGGAFDKFSAEAAPHEPCLRRGSRLRREHLPRRARGDRGPRDVGRRAGDPGRPQPGGGPHRQAVHGAPRGHPPMLGLRRRHVADLLAAGQPQILVLLVPEGRSERLGFMPDQERPGD